MDILNSESLVRMLEKCNDNYGYRGLIVFNSRVTLRDFVEEIGNLNRYASIPGVYIIKQNASSGTIEFTNGSTIHLVLANTTARGNRCDAILFDDSIDDETKDVLRSMVVTRYVDFCNATFCKVFNTDPFENVGDTRELDNFLNEFKIASKK